MEGNKYKRVNAIFFLGEKMNGVKPSGKFDFSHKAEDEKVVSTQ